MTAASRQATDFGLPGPILNSTARHSEWGHETERSECCNEKESTAHEDDNDTDRDRFVRRTRRADGSDSVESLTLENQVLRLEICRSPAPFIERLVHKASGQAVVAVPASRSLFSITFAHEDGKQETIESAAAGESDVSVTKAGTASQVVIKYASSRLPISPSKSRRCATSRIR